jgi:hypothetical protein
MKSINILGLLLIIIFLALGFRQPESQNPVVSKFGEKVAIDTVGNRAITRCLLFIDTNYIVVKGIIRRIIMDR